MEAMHMLQQNLYNENNRYLRWIKRNIRRAFSIYDFIPIIFFIFLFFLKDKQIMDFVLVASMFVYMYGIYNEYRKNKENQNKIPLKVTSRIKRLFFTVILILGIFLSITVKATGEMTVWMLIVLSLLLGFIYYLVSLANFIDTPLNKLEYLYYFNKAKKKLADRNNLEIIGITGSYGKTSSKNILNDILSSKYITRSTPKNYNTPYGIMMTINNDLDKFDEILITEMGAYVNGDIKKICDFVHPKYGILTIIGDAHLETFGTKENIQKTKFELIESLPKDGIAVLNMDDEYQTGYHIQNDVSVKWISINNNKADVYATNIKCNSHGMSFDCHYNKGEKITLKTRILGNHNVYNILASVALALEMNIPIDDIKASVSSLKATEHRLELKKMGSFYMLDDAYNSNPIGASSALDVLKSMNGIKVIVTPGMVELGKLEKEKNYEFGKKIATSCDYVILIGENKTKVIYDALIESGFEKENIFVMNKVVDAYNVINALKEDGVDIYALFENDLPDTYNEK
jgi:UDP-N-acetylmuramoyl-tripeptide--D-alanyl-D-alanine ligase